MTYKKIINKKKSGTLRPTKGVPSCDECCNAGRAYPTYVCSPPVTGIKAVMTLNDFEEGGNGGDRSNCDGRFQWYAKDSCFFEEHTDQRVRAGPCSPSSHGCDKPHVGAKPVPKLAMVHQFIDLYNFS